MVEVPSTKDMIQEVEDNLEVPEIRVWCHPHKIDESGDDYFRVFSTFTEALAFIEENSVAEDHPLIAHRGRELNIFAVEELAPKEGE